MGCRAIAVRTAIGESAVACRRCGRGANAGAGNTTGSDHESADDAQFQAQSVIRVSIRSGSEKVPRASKLGGKGDDSDFNHLRAIGIPAFLNEQFQHADAI